MKPGIFISIITLLVVLFTGCQMHQDTAAILAEADAMEAEFITMAKLKHWGMLGDYYHKSEDVVFYQSGEMRIKGWERMNQMFTDMGSMVSADAEIVYTLDREGEAVMGDHVVTWGMATWKESYPDRDPTSFTWRYTHVKQKIDGKWYYIHDHSSVPMMDVNGDNDKPEDYDDHTGDMD